MSTFLRTLTLATLLPLVARADAPADATALFEQGIKDMQAGNIEQACRELAASLAKYPDSGTKGALAECYTTLGKVASAWNMWKNLADTAPGDDLKADAAANAAKLEARLPHFTIKLAAPALDGLVVALNGNAVADPSLSIALPVDPGPLVASAKAPGYKDWSQTFQAYEGRTTTIEVPALVEAPKPVVKDPVATPNTASMVVVREDLSGLRHSRHVMGGSFVVLGALAVGAGGFFGKKSFDKWDEVKALCGGEQSIGNCPTTQASLVQDKTKQARTAALTSTILFGVGGAAIVVGGIVWLSAPSAERKSATALRLTPTIGPDGMGVSISGGFR